MCLMKCTLQLSLLSNNAWSRWSVDIAAVAPISPFQPAMREREAEMARAVFQQVTQPSLSKCVGVHCPTVLLFCLKCIMQ